MKARGEVMFYVRTGNADIDIKILKHRSILRSLLIFTASILTRLPDNMEKHFYFSAMGGVSKMWRWFIKSKEFITVQEAGWDA
ncbi:hypothetical protein L1049_009167 [Liquidambar formosana]|uniref:Uncharacterized protein n=1 Tax=Liquidambar formosana TaxID=63359 RepID=A0AAP0S4T7_LIQFO